MKERGYQPFFYTSPASTQPEDSGTCISVCVTGLEPCERYETRSCIPTGAGDGGAGLLDRTAGLESSETPTTHHTISPFPP